MHGVRLRRHVAAPRRGTRNVLKARVQPVQRNASSLGECVLEKRGWERQLSGGLCSRSIPATPAPLAHPHVDRSRCRIGSREVRSELVPVRGGQEDSRRQDWCQVGERTRLGKNEDGEELPATRSAECESSRRRAAERARGEEPRNGRRSRAPAANVIRTQAIARQDEDVRVRERVELRIDDGPGSKSTQRGDAALDRGARVDVVQSTCISQKMGSRGGYTPEARSHGAGQRRLYDPDA